MKSRWTLALVATIVAFSAFSCKKKDRDDNDVNLSPASAESIVKAAKTPPIVLTFNIDFADNVDLSDMEDFAAKVETMNESLWNVTEGQVRIGRVRMKDNSHPNTKSMDYNSLNLSARDIVVWSPGDFNGPGIAYVLVGVGRYNHFMGVPSDIANTTFLHEMGHFLWELTWAPAPVLIDEYDKAPTDDACLMELAYTPLRWCWTDNHLTQVGQPHSCWTQILADYPNFVYANTNVAPAPPPPPDFEYTDAP